MDASTPVTVVIPTLNEELHIGGAVDSVGFASQVFVVDTFSTDATVTIAREHGATVVQHQWEGYSEQKNWALDNLPIAHDWVLFLDADEQVTPQLAAEIAAVIQTPRTCVGYYVNRRLHFLGRPMRHAWWYPDKTLRLFLRAHGRFDNRSVHERVVLDGPAGELRHDLVHENLKDLHAFVERHNRYSTSEAREIRDHRRRQSVSTFRASFRGDWGQRKRAIKERIWWRLPLLSRPVARFLHMYVWRRGFLDGTEGLLFSLLIATQELHIDAKLFELELRERQRGALQPTPASGAREAVELPPVAGAGGGR